MRRKCTRASSLENVSRALYRLLTSCRHSSLGLVVAICIHKAKNILAWRHLQGREATILAQKHIHQRFSEKVSYANKSHLQMRSILVLINPRRSFAVFDKDRFGLLTLRKLAGYIWSTWTAHLLDDIFVDGGIN